MADFIINGHITPDGQRVLGYIKTQIAEAEGKGNVDALNGLPGMIKHFVANVHLAKTITEAQWLNDYNYAAGSIFGLLVEADQKVAQEAATQENASQISNLEAAFNQLKEQMEAQVAKLNADNEALREELNSAKAESEPVKSAKKAKTDE